MGRLKQLRSLSRDERRHLASALFWLPATRVLLRLIGFKRTLGFYQQNNDLPLSTPRKIMIWIPPRWSRA